MTTRPILVGELGLLSLFDLVQLFLLNGATGTLRMASGGRQGQIRFERGQVAGALDDVGPDGLESAYRLFTWRAGTFAFSVGTPGGGRTIDESTEGLMLEAARRMDESGATHASPFHTTTLQARVQALAAWRAALEKTAPGITAPLGQPQPAASDAESGEDRESSLKIVKPKGSHKGSKRRRGKGYRDAA